MKTPLFAILAGFCAAQPHSAAAETPAERERELAQLRTQRDQAAAAALEPINRRYQTALEQALHRAMQANDLEAAVKIKAALTELGVTVPVETTKTPLQNLIEGSRWMWYNAPEPKGPAGNWVEFYKDGTGRAGWNQVLHYTIVEPGTLRVTQGAGGPSWVFAVDHAKKEARPDPAESAGHELRSMKLEKRISPLNPVR